jgi:hypothetical protein
MKEIQFPYQNSQVYFSFERLNYPSDHTFFKMKFRVTCKHPVFISASKGSDTVISESLYSIFEDIAATEKEFGNGMRTAFNSAHKVRK